MCEKDRKTGYFRDKRSLTPFLFQRWNKSCSLLTFLCYLALCGWCILAGNAAPVATTEAAKLSGSNVLSSIEFEAKIAGMRKDCEIRNLDPVTLGELVIQRLREDHSTTNDTLLNAVRAIRSYEARIELEEHKQPVTFKHPRTKHFIDKVLPLIRGNAELESSMLLERGITQDQEGDRDGAAKSFQQAYDVISPLRLRIDVDRLRILNLAGSAYLSIGQHVNAQNMFRNVLSYNWPTVDDPIRLREAMELYIQAGHGLIEACRHDLKSLQQIRFYPSTMDELGPILQKAKDEAALEPKREK